MIQYQMNCRASTMKKVSTQNADAIKMEHDYQRNVNLSTQLSRWLLKPIGAWPKSSNTSLIEKYFTWFMYAVCYLLITYLIVPCLTFLILEVKGTYNKIKLIGPLSFFLMSFMKYNLILFHKNDILKCVEKIEWDWRNMKHLEERNIMVMNMNYGRRLIIVYALFVYGSFVFYYIIMPLSGGKIPAGDANFTFIPLPFPSSLRITDYRKSPVNEIFFVAQCLSGVVLDAVTVGTCSLAATFATHACGQMEVLMNWLEHLLNGRSGMSKSVDGRIASIVEQHVRVLNFLALIEKMFQTISCIECLGCMMNLCLLGYYLIMEWNGQNLTSSFTYISLILYFGLNIFVFCYTGELVAEQCRRVGEMSYMTDWYRLSGKKKLCCILIIAMSNSSIKLTAGNMIELSIGTFSDVVRTAVAFLNMLRALT